MPRTPAPFAPTLLFAGLACLATGPAEAAMRCGNKLISEGDTRGELLTRCGEPAEVTRNVALRPPIFWEGGRPWRVPGGDIEVQIEIWTYNFGSTQLMRRVTLEDGIVKQIDTLGYGY